MDLLLELLLFLVDFLLELFFLLLDGLLDLLLDEALPSSSTEASLLFGLPFLDLLLLTDCQLLVLLELLLRLLDLPRWGVVLEVDFPWPFFLPVDFFLREALLWRLEPLLEFFEDEPGLLDACS